MDYTVVAIDFGTSTTVVKVRNFGNGVDPNEYYSLQFYNSNTFPTLVFEADKDGRLSFGYEAEINYDESQMNNDKKGHLYKNFRMGLLSADPNTKKKAEELTAAFFKYLYDKLVEQKQTLHIKPKFKTYISFPTKWTQELMQFIKECAEKAGFTDVNGVYEATAAIFALNHRILDLEKEGIVRCNEFVNVMKLDMGGETTDIEIYNFNIDAGKNLSHGFLSPWPPIGNPDFGGREIEEKLKEEIINYITKISKDGQVSAILAKRIKKMVKPWINQLDIQLERKGSVALPSGLMELIQARQEEGIYEKIPFEKIDRRRFESITGEYWKQLRALIDGALRNVSKKIDGFNGAGDIDLIILIGEHSLRYAVRELILGEKIAGCEPINFSKIKQNPLRVLQEESPRETVSLGLLMMDNGESDLENDNDDNNFESINSETSGRNNSDNTDYTVVGIDFGTSTTVVKMRNYYKTGTMPADCPTLQFDSSNLLPTLVFKAGDGSLFFGKEALIREADRKKGEIEGRLHENFKMRLVNENPDMEKEAKELTREFFKYIYSEFNEKRAIYGVLPEVKTYVSYPVKWTSDIISFMLECAKNENAGFTNVEGIDEANAAIYASIPNNLDYLQKEEILISGKPVNVMMLDMGAGTSDIAVFNFKIGADKKLVSGNTVKWPPIDKQNCGGGEIEEYLAAELENYIKKISKKDEIKINVKEKIKDSVKGWKEEHLSPKLKDRGSVGLPNRLDEFVLEKQEDGVYENIQFEKIDRQRFESITREHWKQLRELIDGALRNASASKKLSGFNGAGDIDLIILTGGHSKWYGVREFIQGEKFAGCEPVNFTKIRENPARILQEASPQETVALGLVKMKEFIEKGFDLKPTIGNSVWIQYIIIDLKSEILPIIQHNAVLPVELTNEYSCLVEASTASRENIYFGICCYYGTNITTAKFNQIDGKIKLNTIGNALRGILQGGLGGARENYTVTIQTSIKVLKDGRINLRGTVKSQYGKPESFYFEL